MTHPSYLQVDSKSGSRLPRLGSACAGIVCILAIGCQDRSSPPAPVVAAPNSDQQILQALDYYDPMYKVDAKGRVIRLRLVWRHLPDSVLAEIGKLTELKGMDLAGTTVTDQGLAQLK